MKIKDMPNNVRPRERFSDVGLDNLTDLELLAIIIKSGTKESSVLEVATKVLKEIVKKDNIEDLKLNELIKIKGIGLIKAQTILAGIELGKRIYLKPSKSTKVLKSPEEIYKYMRYEIHNLKQEHFYCLYFDNQQQLLKKKLHFIGTLNKSVVHPREIFKEAYNLSANSIICLHNHPSGNLEPSLEDIRFTKALIEIGKLNGISISDHLIITNDSYYSFYENGLML